MKYYLAKSNKTNPDLLIGVRSILFNLGEVEEFQGGYWLDHVNVIATCDVMVVLSHPQEIIDDCVFIGRGLMTTIDEFRKIITGAEHKKIYYAHFTTGNAIVLFPVIGVVINDVNNWTISYGKMTLDSSKLTTLFSTLLSPEKNEKD